MGSNPRRKTVAVVCDVIFLESSRSDVPLVRESSASQDYVRVPEIPEEADGENEVAAEDIVVDDNFDGCVEKTIGEDGAESMAENEQEDGEWR